MKTCINCGNEYPLSEFREQNETKDGHANQCRLCLNTIQRERRKKNENKTTSIYEKTPKEFLVREYRNMKSRVTGVQKKKAHLYLGKPLLDKEDFYRWAIFHIDFVLLYTEWVRSNYNRKLTPTVDRVDSSKGYELGNMEWVTHSENSRRGSLSRNKIYGYS